MLYDPIEDEKKQFTIREFEEIVKTAITEYANVFEGANKFTMGKHTYNEWMNTFGRFMSW